MCCLYHLGRLLFGMKQLNGKLSESEVIKINTPHDRVKIITLYLDTALQLHSFLLESTMNAACQLY